LKFFNRAKRSKRAESPRDGENNDYSSNSKQEDPFRAASQHEWKE